MIITLAGRRVDAPDAKKKRFPLENINEVRKRIHELFQHYGVTGLVCSGACGADLLALDVAHQMNIKYRVILPFTPEQFRKTSVVDRPGEWGPVFDQLIEEAKRTEDLIILNLKDDSEQTFLTANKEILSQALSMANSLPLSQGQASQSPTENVLAVVVWDGSSRGNDDVTNAFKIDAQALKLNVVEILTL